MIDNRCIDRLVGWFVINKFGVIDKYVDRKVNYNM